MFETSLKISESSTGKAKSLTPRRAWNTLWVFQFPNQRLEEYHSCRVWGAYNRAMRLIRGWKGQTPDPTNSLEYTPGARVGSPTRPSDSFKIRLSQNQQQPQWRMAHTL